MAMNRGTTMETESNQEERWTSSRIQMWALRTDDGYVGQAHWREQGAGVAVTRPDGTELFRRTWGSTAMFLDSCPGMFAWLNRRVTEPIAGVRARSRSARFPA